MNQTAFAAGWEAARVVERIEPDTLEPGTVSRLAVEIAHDGLGRPIRLPVLAARGVRPGPVLGVTAAVHGNELNGIPVIHRLFHTLDPTNLAGTIVAVVVVNVPGFLAHEREFMGWDLNHCFPGAPDGNAASVFVHRLVHRVLRSFDLLLDLHTASFGRVNSLYVRADMTDPATAHMAYLQRPQILVHNPPADMTLRGAAAELGIPAITVEIGNPSRFHSDFVKRALTGVRSVLSDQHMLRQRPVVPGPEPVLCERSRWLYTDRGGLLEVLPSVTAAVSEGEVVARITDVFGEMVAEYTAPEAGVVIGHAVNPVASTGARILHLGIPAPPDDPRYVRRVEEDPA